MEFQLVNSFISIKSIYFLQINIPKHLFIKVPIEK